MIHYIPAATFSVWLAVIVVQLAVAIMAAMRGIHARYPAFASLVYVLAAKSCILLAISIFGTQRAYLYAFTGMSLVTEVCMGLLVRELYVVTFGPPESLPRFIQRNVSIVAPTTIGSGIVLALLAKVFGVIALLRVLDRFEKMTLFSLCIVLWWMVVYSRRVGISWRNLPSRVAAGFLITLTINSVSMAARGLPGQGPLSNVVGLGGHLFGLLVWAVSLMKQEEVAPKATVEELKAAKLRMEEARAQFDVLRGEARTYLRVE